MPSRFSAAFRRKSATNPDELRPQPLSSEPTTSSFRVLERNPAPGGGPSFDGGARMVHAHTAPSHKLTNSDPQVQDNIFAGLNHYR